MDSAMDFSTMEGFSNDIEGEVSYINKRRRTNDDDEQRTLYIQQLPYDVTEREMRNTLIFLEGFLSCTLYRKKMPKMNAFALFESQTLALEAKIRLDSLVFDPQNAPGATLVCRLAKKNMVVSRQERMQTQKDNAGQDKILNPQEPIKEEILRVGFSTPQRARYQLPYQVPSQHGMPQVGYKYDPSQQYNISNVANIPLLPGSPSDSSMPASFVMPNIRPMIPSSSLPASPHQAPKLRTHSSGHKGVPGTTLFISNLNNITEEELLDLVSQSCEGYQDSKIIRDRRGNKVVFVAFHSTELATCAKESIGTYKGINVTYAKNALNQPSSRAPREELQMTGV